MEFFQEILGLSVYEKVSVIIGVLTVLTAGGFAYWQSSISRRLTRLSSFVAVAIVPAEDGRVKLLNTGKVNLYIHGFEIAGITTLFRQGRLISQGSLDSSYFWLSLPPFPGPCLFNITLFLSDEDKKKYVATGGGEVKKMGDKLQVTVWANRMTKFKWNFPNSDL